MIPDKQSHHHITHVIVNIADSQQHSRYGTYTVYTTTAVSDI